MAVTGRICGVPWIIVHSHGDSRGEHAAAGVPMKLKTRLAAFLQRLAADAGLACAEGACELLDMGWRTSRLARALLRDGLAPFARTVDRPELRRRLGLPPDACVIGNVGRCETVKNQDFIIDIAVRYARRNSDAHFVVAGGGGLLPLLESRARMTGLGNRIRLPGTMCRTDLAPFGLAIKHKAQEERDKRLARETYPGFFNVT